MNEFIVTVKFEGVEVEVRDNSGPLPSTQRLTIERAIKAAITLRDSDRVVLSGSPR